MTAEAKGRDLFIVDNSVSGWTALRYLEEWCGIAKAFDIATGYFEIGALLALDGKWQPLEKIRILMGAEMTYRTRKALLEAVRSRALEVLDASIETDKDANPFLQGVPRYRRRWEEKLSWYRAHGILPQEEGSGENGTLIITRDEANGSIDSAKITKLIADVFD